ncbi:DNA recombination protein RmuC [Algicola sagamiensis]|uniref:DNA recombination protein RmuC n=1 Tax=Algicola sagamiensis TaxID=163869 RepID=UPI00036DD254|nr:DNA recombination protein RmuC [Algicola sagamiensis]
MTEFLLPFMITAGVLLVVILLLVIQILRRHNHTELTLAMAQLQEQTLQIIQNNQAFQTQLSQQLQEQLGRIDQKNAGQASLLQQQIAIFREQLLEKVHQQQLQLLQGQSTSFEKLSEQLNQTTRSSREELAKSLHQSTETLNQRMAELSDRTDLRLKEIGGQVEKRLSEGFEKTTQTFHDILKRLALIDDAQKKITELSSNVVSLQEVLADKRSRGAFGEVQLSGLIRNMMPEQHFSFQHTLSNGKIADCVLFLPPPTGNMVIDAKFPLESYRKMMDEQLPQSERKFAERQFKQDIKKHVTDIHSKYLIPGETSEGAIMFIPAEAVFAEIHAHHPDILEYAYQQRIWLTSPTTLMAVLTTARSVLKDEATNQQIHLIQDHLVKLGQDFGRFRVRFDNLAKHIDQAASDVKQIHTSAHKISSRFEQIEQVDLGELEQGIGQRIELP